MRWFLGLTFAAQVMFWHACLAASPAHQKATPSYDMAITIDPDKRTLTGSGTIGVAAGPGFELSLARRFEVDSMTLDGRPVGEPRISDGLQVWSIDSANSVRKIAVRWHGMLAPLDATLDHRQTLTAAAPVTGAQGTFLPASSAWYPQPAGLIGSYRMAIELPAGQRGVVAGRLIEASEKDGRYRARYEFLHPSEGIDLMAGPYRVDSRSVRTADGKNLVLRTYFHPEIAELSSGYLDAAKGYFDLYERWIGPYPYGEFSIVSSPTPTGFGLPTLTYLGIDVLKLPFIRTTSLGHEILHNWWGNGVYPDYGHGNWSEGLTTFMADYAYKERESPEAARKLRLEWLRDFAAVPSGEDRPLAQFTSRVHDSSQIIGYGKAAMIFVMLRDSIGRDVFDRGIKLFWGGHRFKVASWNSLQKSFETVATRDLAPFFSQWLTRTGAPSVRIAAVERLHGAKGAQVRVTLRQNQPTYRLRVPVSIRTAHGEEWHYLDLADEVAIYTLSVHAPAIELVLDPDYRLFRRLAEDEAPAILRQVTLDPEATTFLIGTSGAAEQSARGLAEKMQDHPPRIATSSDPAGRGTMLVIGIEHDIDAWLSSHGLPKMPASLAHRGSAAVWTATLPQGNTMAVVAARDADALAALVRPLPHYGRQSYLAFEGAKVIESGVWPARPQVWRLAPEANKLK